MPGLVEETVDLLRRNQHVPARVGDDVLIRELVGEPCEAIAMPLSARI